MIVIINFSLFNGRQPKHKTTMKVSREKYIYLCLESAHARVNQSDPKHGTASVHTTETLSPKRVNREVVSYESRVIFILYNRRRFVDPE